MKYGFIGCGNMGGAIAKALSRATKEIMVSDRSGKAKAFAEELGVKNATLMWPLRIACAGKLVTPGGAVEICKILGKDETIRRVKCGIEKLGG